jgi:hypothetical protein
MRRTGAAILLLATLAGVPSGCALIDTHKTKLRLSHVPSDPANKKSPRDRFVEALGKTSDPDAGASALALAPIELWAPFSVELTVGVFDLDAHEATLGATACLELDAAEDLGEPFAFMCADFLRGLTQTRSSVDGSLAEEHFAIVEVELQLEATEDTLFFRSRERGADEWIEIANVPFVQTEGLLPGLSVADLLKKGRIGFDDFRVEPGGTAPTPPTDADTFVAHVQTALLRSYDACADLDGADIEFNAAQGELDLALAALADAAAQLQLLPESKDARKAGKRLAQTEKKLRSALAKIAKNKEEPAIKSIQKAIRSGADAILLIEPRSL